jgi:AcrR family transcriptional regulator
VRKDAERNRENLIEAARTIMRDGGADVPMEAIAERAGLTRGTLYRNFAHRQAMYEAVLQGDLEGIVERLEKDSAADPLAFIKSMTELIMVYDKFLISLADMADYDAATNAARMVDVIAAPLAAAQGQGLLRADLTGADILIVCRMLASQWRLDHQPDLRTAMDERLALMLRGIGGQSAPAAQNL